MTSWQYFYKIYGDANSDEQPRALGRTDADGPKYNAQMLVRPAEWMSSDFLVRYHLLGSNDDDYVKISEDRAIEIIEDWVASGRLTRWPDEPKRPSA
jgi:hypothetical protein